MIIAIGSDHRGYPHRDRLRVALAASGHEVVDCGAPGPGPADYPHPAFAVGERVAGGAADLGILICGSGIGVAIAANKVAGVRAALCLDPEAATMTRRHNDSNVLCLSGDRTTPDAAVAIAEAYLAASFEGGRHARRVDQITEYESKHHQERGPAMYDAVRQTDPEIAAVLAAELGRQRSQLEMIASENFTSRAVLETMGSVLTNKYAEGYPGKRYYGGCVHVDEAETLAKDRACLLFEAERANVQPHSGSTANLTAYLAFCKPGDKILGLSLSHGGHLTHGHPVNFSGLFFEAIHYEVERGSETIDYDRMRDQAKRERPRLLVGGASAYPRTWDYAAMRSIADEVGAIFVFDMAHIAGLVAGKVHPSPVPFADVVTSTTHKTLRGPRGGLIVCKKDHLKAINKMNFPGIQGGPLMHMIAAKAVCFHECLQPAFRTYAQRTLDNAQALAAALIAKGFRLASGGTDNHLLLVNCKPRGLTGKEMEELLERVGITCNKNTVPFDEESPVVTSGVRLGTPALTTRGMGPAEMRRIADLMDRAVASRTDDAALANLRAESEELCRAFPLYPE
ncbi:MAG TPA: ribose 5-phosphate isomerase B [Candidatus Krumholzibacteria bacterium]|nr:ribose 5-phosphate isomerase B [Candidatus Krumholzibacteria bacterium]HPD71261.1 ribose 5-phosphate isomerase B [Candidatus Krumholzibacteria bacterium]HRY39039.1 ribose 5-phosphate isomerase B [Candidatus Krumholzibacteria bacterium]